MSINLKEPVPNTCDTLDKLIETMDDVCDTLSSVQREIKEMDGNVEEKLDIMESIITCKVIIKNLSTGDLSPVESIRNANEVLREWGNNLVEAYEEVLTKVSKKKK